MQSKSITYRDAGVDIDKGDGFVEKIKPFVKSTFHNNVLNNIGGFASLASIPSNYKEPLIVTSTDGVGTKLLLALQAQSFDQLGYDLVAMCVNDLLTMGAQPFLFLDYLACQAIDEAVLVPLVQSIAKACKLAGCALVGGETAEMPGLYTKGDFDVSGFCVGLIEKSEVIDGQNIVEGDCIYAFKSSGAHSNGYSLIRKIIEHANLKLSHTLKDGRSLQEALLEGTNIYVDDVNVFKSKAVLHGMAHITGGGIEGNLSRIIPQGLCADISLSAWTVPEVFTFLQDQGGVELKEMFKTFNMGLGYVVVCPELSPEIVQSFKGKLLQVGKISADNSSNATEQVKVKLV